MKRIPAIAIVLLFASLISHPSFAYHLPDVSISSEEWDLPSDAVLEKQEGAMEEIKNVTVISRLDEHLKNPKKRLTKKEKEIYPHYVGVKGKVEFWQYVTRLKKDLAELHQKNDDDRYKKEADQMAKTIVARLYELSQGWKAGGSALFNNFLINIGAREKGFCYHYVEELTKALKAREWKYYDIKWGEAYAKDFRENNALVITAHQRPFESGIAVDAWRSGGRPFWARVKEDRFLWKEAKD